MPHPRSNRRPAGAPVFCLFLLYCLWDSSYAIMDSSKKKGDEPMSIIWYLAVSLTFLSTGLAGSLLAENRKLKAQVGEPAEEPVIERHFRSFQA